MKPVVDERQMLSEYLLGRLSEQEQEELAERYFADDELFDQLLAVENDLLDQYVRGQLAPDEREGFERYLKRLPDGQHKVGVATALTAPSKEVPEPASWWQFLLPLVPRPQSVLQYALAVGLVVMAGGILWLVIHSQRLRREDGQLRAQIAQGEAEQEALRQKVQALEQQFVAQQTRIEQLPGEQKRDQQRGNEQAQEIARSKKSPSPFAFLTLTPASRTFSTPDTLVLTRGTKFVSLTVPIKDSEKYLGRPAVLQTTEGEQVQQLRSRQVRSPRLGKAVVLRLATSQLTQTSYKLTLTLMAEDGLELAHDYYFNVVKR